MNLARHVPVDEMADALESGRRRLASIDFNEIQDSARSAAMSAFPNAWRRPKPRRRWPFVAAVLVIGAAFVGFMFLVPSLRRGPGADLTPEREPADEFPTNADRDHPGAGDVVEGPVGSSSLKEPTAGPMGADLSELEPIDSRAAGQTGSPAI